MGRIWIYFFTNESFVMFLLLLHIFMCFCVGLSFIPGFTLKMTQRYARNVCYLYPEKTITDKDLLTVFS